MSGEHFTSNDPHNPAVVTINGESYQPRYAWGDSSLIASSYESPETIANLPATVEAKPATVEARTAELIQKYGLTDVPDAATLAELETAEGNTSPASEDSQDTESLHSFTLPQELQGDLMAEAFAAFSDGWLEQSHVDHIMNNFLPVYLDAEAQMYERKDAVDSETCNRELTKAWSINTQANIATVAKFMKALPTEVYDAVFETRLPNGLALGNDPQTLMALFAIAKRMKT